MMKCYTLSSLIILLLNLGTNLLACPTCTPYPTPPKLPPKHPHMPPPKVNPPSPPNLPKFPPPPPFVPKPPIVKPPFVPKPPIVEPPPVVPKPPPYVPKPPIVTPPFIPKPPPSIPNPPIVTKPPPTPPVEKPCPPPPPPPPVPCPPPPKSEPETCPIDTLKLGACVDILGGLIHVGIGSSAKDTCCPVLEGLVDLDAAICLCTTIKAKLLNINIIIPIALQVLLDCGKSPPPGFQCSS